MLRTVTSATLLVLLGLALASCRGSSPERESIPPYPRLESAELGSMRNVSRSGELWFGSAPSEEDLDLATRRGIVAVIDLSTTEEGIGPAIGTQSQEKGLRYLHAGESELAIYTDETVDRVLGELTRSPAEPILLYCGNGTRCAMFVAIHRATNEGVPLEQALVEARRAGMKPGDPEIFVRQQVQRLAEAAEDGDRS